jgi:hypothetical protein
MDVNDCGVYQISCRFEFGTAPNHRREQAQLCPINCTLELAQPQLQKWGRCNTAVFPKMFMFREKLSQVSPVPQDYNITPPSLRTAAPLQFATVYKNSLEMEGPGVSIRAPSLPGPSFMHVWSSVCCLFQHLPLPQLRFLGQAHVACKKWLLARSQKWGSNHHTAHLEYIHFVN